MSNAIVRDAKSTHYAVSTFAAVVYAVVWLVANRAHAEAPVAQAMPEVVITARREAPQAAMPEIVVWGKREITTPAAMEEVYVYAKRESAAKDARIAAVAPSTNGIGMNTKSSGWTVKARHWLQTALLK